jgi:PPM family protein phosphatase
MSWLSRLRPSQPSAADAAPAPAAEPFLLDADLLSDVGCVRSNNEDAGRIVRGEEDTSGQHRLLVIIADGMGGYSAGEVASALAADTLEAAFPSMAADPAKHLRQAVIDANHRIFTEAAAISERNGMGTTCTALLIQNGRAWSAHVGDSRLYLLRNGAIYLVTEDHSQVMEMVKAGLLTREEARHHPEKNVITRALGRQPEVDVALWAQPMPVSPGDGFLLCSDGLCDVLEDDELNAVASAHSAADACEALVRLAKQRNASDNITVAIVKLLAVPATAGSTVWGAHPANEPGAVSRPTRRVEIEA